MGNQWDAVREMEDKWYLAADDAFSFVSVEGEVMLDYVEGSPSGSFWNVWLAVPGKREHNDKKSMSSYEEFKIQ